MEFRRAILSALTAGFLFTPLPGTAQSVRPEDLAQGKIIITPRDSPDPHFANSVIVLANYGRTGALGLMIHYKSDLTIQKALTGLKGAEKRTDMVFVGGPVEIPMVLALLRSKSTPEGASHVTGNLYLMTAKQSITTALVGGRPASDLRIFGSVARDDAVETSDLDLLVRFEPGRSLMDHGMLIEELQELLDIKVDVVSEGALRNDDRFRREVLKEAVSL